MGFLDGRIFDGYDRDGEPISDAQAVDLMSGPLEDRIVRQAHVGDFLVSTVHTVVNHAPLGEPPMVFETMIVPLADSDEFREYAPNEVSALAAHDRAVEFARELSVDGGPDDTTRGSRGGARSSGDRAPLPARRRGKSADRATGTRQRGSRPNPRTRSDER